MLGQQIPPWTKMMIDSEAAIWIWNNLYNPPKTGEGGKTSYKDTLQQKFQLEDYESERKKDELKQKALLAGRGYDIAK